MSTNKRAAIYARVSTQEQDDDGKTSIPEQIRDCQRYADEHGYIVQHEHIFADTASGYTLDRQALDQLRDLVHDRLLDVVICYSLDRLGRDSTQSAVLELELARRMVTIEYVTGQYADTPEGRFQKNVMRAAYEAEGEFLKRRMLRGKLGELRKGSVMTDTAPYGYSKIITDDGRRNFAINKQEAEVVQLIFQLFVFGDQATGDGPMRIEQIKNRLHAMQVPTRTHTLERTQKRYNGPTQWANSTIFGILKNETYTGTWRYGKTQSVKVVVEEQGRVRTYTQEKRRKGDELANESITVTVPMLIDPELFARAQERLEHNKATAQRNRRTDYLFSSRLTCIVCGRKWRGQRPYVQRILYRCTGRERKPVRICEMPVFYEDELDAVIWPWVRELIEHPERIRTKLEEKQHDKGLLSLQERLASVDELLQRNSEALKRYRHRYGMGKLDEDELDQLEAPIQKEIKGLQQERDKLLKHIEQISYTDERITSIVEACALTREGLGVVEQWHEKKALIYDMLRLEATLEVRDGKKIAHVRCILDERTLYAGNTGE